jgi:hypothetical protein
MDINQVIKSLEDIIESLRQQKSEIDYKALHVGDVLPDGSVVVYKEAAELLIAAPQETEVECSWSEEFSPVFEKLKEKGLNPDDWFIPNVGQLYLAYVYNKKAFASTGYWSSTEASSTLSCGVYFFNGIQGTGSKAGTCCVRAFRRVIL